MRQLYAGKRQGGIRCLGLRHGRRCRGAIILLGVMLGVLAFLAFLAVGTAFRLFHHLRKGNFIRLI